MPAPAARPPDPDTRQGDPDTRQGDPDTRQGGLPLRGAGPAPPFHRFPGSARTPQGNPAGQAPPHCLPDTARRATGGRPDHSRRRPRPTACLHFRAPPHTLRPDPSGQPRTAARAPPGGSTSGPGRGRRGPARAPHRPAGRGAPYAWRLGGGRPARASRGRGGSGRAVCGLQRDGRHVVPRCETASSASWTVVDSSNRHVTRFRHEWSWNCLGESTPRRPGPHVQRHLSGALTEPATAAQRTAQRRRRCAEHRSPLKAEDRPDHRQHRERAVIGRTRSASATSQGPCRHLPLPLP